MKRLLIFLPLLLNACIVIDDFGDAWKKAEGDICLNRINTALYAQVHEREVREDTIESLARGITLNGNHYILMKEKPSDKGGFLFRFTVKEGIFTRYKLNPTMRDRFTRDYPDASVNITDTTVTLANISPENLRLLTAISKEKIYWQEDDRTLYNPIQNKLCRFEDRDLNAKSE